MTTRLLCIALGLLLAGCPTPTPRPDGGTGSTPILTSLTPTRGPGAGGTIVTLNGTGFDVGATVTFGAQPGTVVVVESSTRATATTPAGSAGAVTVTLTNPGGKSSSLLNAFTYEGSVTSRPIAEALVVNPAEVTDSTGSATVSVSVIGHVQVAMVTPGAGQGAGVQAQVGYAASVSATPAQADFTWSAASYLGDVDGPATGDLLRDSYSGMVTLPGATTGQVTYRLAARFSTDNGVSWTLADRDGAANGVALDQLPRVVVTNASVEWCKLGGEAVQAPPTVTLRGSTPGPTVYGQVYKPGVTDQANAGADLRGALGFGAMGADPSTWTWVDATFNRDTNGGSNDEFQAQLPNPGTGTYRYAFRFSHANGPWTYCDADGLATNGFTEDQSGTLTVQAVGIDSCVLQYPSALTTYEGRQSERVYGRVFVAGVTDVTGAGAGVEGQLGFGAPTASPADAGWDWSAAGTFNVDVAAGGGDEFEARLPGPAPGTYAYAWRFRVAGSEWSYCDADGSGNGFQALQAGALTANAFDVTTCTLEAANATQAVMPSATSQPYSMVVTVPTSTDATGQGAGVTVELARGAVGTDPSTWGGWAAASYATDVGTADRYTATLQAPGTTGTSDVAFRVRVGTRPFVYCDRDGSPNGYQSAQAGQLTVASALVQSCALTTPSAFSLMSGGRLEGGARVLVPGVSGSAGASPNLEVQLGVGPQGDNASTSGLWGWASVPYLGELTGEDEFRGATYPAYTGNRAVAARARIAGQQWVYCDLNGSDVGGYEVNQQYDVTVTAHAEFDYCGTQQPPTSAAPGATVYGQIYEPGLTPNPATPFLAQLGTGAESEDPGLAWSWQAATFNVTVNNNNEYQATVPDAGTGTRYAFRYSLDGGVWCYGDFDGAQNGFSGGANVGTIQP